MVYCVSLYCIMNIPLPVIIATIISCVGNTFTFLTYMMFPELRTPSQIFALWLAIGSYGNEIICLQSVCYNVYCNRVLLVYLFAYDVLHPHSLQNLRTFVILLWTCIRFYNCCYCKLYEKYLSKPRYSKSTVSGPCNSKTLFRGVCVSDVLSVATCNYK